MSRYIVIVIEESGESKTCWLNGESNDQMATEDLNLAKATKASLESIYKHVQYQIITIK